MVYARLPTEQEAAAAGFAVSDYEEEAEVWPENWSAFCLFSMLQSQWDVSMSGPTGLKYQVLFELMDRHELDGDDWWLMFNDIRSMEAAALNSMRETTAS